MPAERSGVPIDALRAAVQLRIEQRTLRSVAKDIGMSPSGLWSFVLATGRPYGATYQKLLSWYVRDQARRDGITPESVQAALTLLVAQLPRAKRDQLRKEIIALVARKLPPRKRADWIRVASS